MVSRARFNGTFLDMAEALEPLVKSKNWILYSESDKVANVKTDSRKVVKNAVLLAAAYGLNERLCFKKTDSIACMGELFNRSSGRLGLSLDQKDEWVRCCDLRFRNVCRAFAQALTKKSAWATQLNFIEGEVPDEKEDGGCGGEDLEEAGEEDLDGDDEDLEAAEEEEEDLEDAEEDAEEEEDDSDHAPIENLTKSLESAKKKPASPPSAKINVDPYFVGFDEDTSTCYRKLGKTGKKQFGTLECTPGSAKTDNPVGRWPDGYTKAIAALTVAQTQEMWKASRSCSGKNTFWTGTCQEDSIKVRGCFKADHTELVAIVKAGTQIFQIQMKDIGDDKDVARKIISSIGQAYCDGELSLNQLKDKAKKSELLKKFGIGDKYKPIASSGSSGNSRPAAAPKSKAKAKAKAKAEGKTARGEQANDKDESVPTTPPPKRRKSSARLSERLFDMQAPEPNMFESIDDVLAEADF
jgi:hypothetical protein